MSNWLYSLACITIGVLAGFLLASITYASADHADSGTWQQQTITVETEPGVDVAAMVAPWNDMAGRQLLKPVPAGGRADVLLSPSEDRSWVQRRRIGDRMTFCRIHYGTVRPDYVMQHEMGHCLGFGDHVTSSEDQWNRRQCAESDAANYSAYRGVMAYCGFRDPAYRNWRWFAQADVAMFKRAYPQ